LERKHHEVHVTEIREVEPDSEGFHRFERSLQPFLDVLMRPGWEHESKNALFGQITSGPVTCKLKEFFASQPIDKIEKLLSLFVKSVAFLGFLIITWHALGLGYLKDQRIYVDGPGRDQIYRQANVTPFQSHTADWWYFDRVEILSRIGDPVMIVIPGTYEDGQQPCRM